MDRKRLSCCLHWLSSSTSLQLLRRTSVEQIIPLQDQTRQDSAATSLNCRVSMRLSTRNESQGDFQELPQWKKPILAHTALTLKLGDVLELF